MPSPPGGGSVSTDIQKPDPAHATHEQLMGFKVFEDWRNCIQRGQMHSNPWLEMLKHVATKQAEKEEAAAQLASIRSYKLWIEGGAAGGLMRHHQFTRNGTGWTETALSKGSLSELGEQADMDGLSEEQIEAVRTNVGDTTSRAGVQTEVNDQAAAWKKVWGGSLADKSDPTWPDDLGAIPQGSSSKHCWLPRTPSHGDGAWVGPASSKGSNSAISGYSSLAICRTAQYRKNRRMGGGG